MKIDKNLNGIIDELTTYLYDVNGKLSTQRVDKNNDGSIDESTNYSYDEGGRLTAEVLDKNNDRKVDQVTSYNYDTSGKLITEDIDSNTDGTTDAVVSYLYNQQGQLTSQTTEDKTVVGKCLWGGKGNDKLTGDAGNDKIVGKNGNDLLFGKAGNDKLIGGNGNDKLVGGAGGDSLTGGCGVDTFVYTSLSDSLLSKRDAIEDLKIGEDKIDSIHAVSAADLVQLGAVVSLNFADVQTVLTSSDFLAKGAATFTLGTGTQQQTFLALNDDVNGFSALTDAVVEITGYKGNLANLAVV
ncbi:bluetail domain-containing putative surface protein [Nostoc sp. 'Peltigera malacea cyanobiont' DB3992]|uniref:bluetail domain-containing putative surface protein n=1 Tax=Nostoc sp. 'Peltigera malacea cyanobiont' DB3992 TaxID=1206980 RepID=UPI000C05079D|nr:bluetail domain-containing putative surface protein [Nostoc sp. 'Peltigera malacea cyanobiont' DB3992]PHM07789.1 hypothetical protein CK516_24790 [Nostoc sp. 'Peltigera malacea cyanobiont' DB3992]